MLKLLDHMIKSNVAKNLGDAAEHIGFNNANMWKVKRGKNKFTVDQIEAACRITGASADYVFGLTATMMRKPARRPIDQIREAVQTLETMLSKRQ